MEIEYMNYEEQPYCIWHADDAVRLKNGDGRVHYIKEFVYKGFWNGLHIWKVIFADPSAVDLIDSAGFSMMEKVDNDYISMHDTTGRKIVA